MQRRSSKKTRAENADEKRFKIWVAEQPCIECGDYPVIVDHCMGSTWKNNKVLVGMWYLIPLCQHHDDIKTQGSRRGFINRYGLMSKMWGRLIEGYAGEIPADVIYSIVNSNT